MRILLTGARGFIGSRLAEKLAEAGHELVLLCRDPGAQGLPIGARAFSISNPDPAAFQGLSAVVHLAGEPIADGRWTRARKERIRDSRVLGTRELLQAIRQHADVLPKVLLSASAIGYYGYDRGEEEIEERAEPGADFLAGICRSWEQEAGALGADTRHVVLRFGIVLGRGGGAVKKLEPIARTGLLGRLSSGQQWMSWIHIDDAVAAAIALLGDASAAGAFNLVAPGQRRNGDFTQVFAQSLGKGTGPAVPAFALRLLSGEMAEALLGSLKVAPGRLRSLGYRFRYPDLEGALTEIFPGTGDQPRKAPK